MLEFPELCDEASLHESTSGLGRLFESAAEPQGGAWPSWTLFSFSPTPNMAPAMLDAVCCTSLTGEGDGLAIPTDPVGKPGFGATEITNKNVTALSLHETLPCANAIGRGNVVCAGAMWKSSVKELADIQTDGGTVSDCNSFALREKQFRPQH